jgi:hypothetical protein
MAETKTDLPAWKLPLPEDTDLAKQTEEARQRHLLLDARYPGETNRYVLDPMYRTGLRFWIMIVILGDRKSVV